MPACSDAREASASALTSVAQTFAPSFARQMAEARPMPWPAEVTIAVFPESLPAMDFSPLILFNWRPNYRLGARLVHE
jgi:hypothetical protein